MKRLLTLLLAVALLLGTLATLASCGEKPVDPTPAPDDAHTHDYATVVADGPLKHKKTCSCGNLIVENHKMVQDSEQNENGMIVTRCSVCGYESYAYPWETETELTMWVTENYNGNELLSGNRAFVAGDLDSSKYSTQSLTVDDPTLLQAVVARNNLAESATRVHLTYVYNDSFAWGKQMGEINSQISGGHGYDMYCGFVYDMVGVELNKNFANLKNSKYFTFNHQDYDPSKDEQGYFWDYMDSLAFSTKGKFLVASNYVVDIVRSYFVTPVSIKLIKKTGLTTDQFIELVNTNKYTWALITDMIEGNLEKGIKGVGTPGIDSYTFKNTNDGAIWGFLLGKTSMLPIAGVCYANNYSIIDRTVDENGEYVYTYNDSADFAAMSDALQKTIGSSSAILSVAKASYDGTSNDIVCIRTAFNEQRVLVGGVIVLGAIEALSYRRMWDEDNDKEGFVVTPMPLYNEGDEYRTVIHNLAKVIGVSRSSADLDRCAAYVDYCSTNSATILDDYYNWSLAMGTAGVFEDNVTIIQDMRSRLVCTIDKIVDDAIALTGQKGRVNVNGESTEVTLDKNYRFHAMLQANYSKGSGISAKYDEVRPAKQVAVQALQQLFLEACGERAE